MSRKITFLTLFLWLMTVTFPVIAQQKADTTYTFRFVPRLPACWSVSKKTKPQFLTASCRFMLMATATH